MMQLLIPAFELVDPRPSYPPAWPALTDQWDHPIWAAAVEGGASYVISENTSDFPPSQADERHVYNGIEYLRGAKFLARLADDTL